MNRRTFGRLGAAAVLRQPLIGLLGASLETGWNLGIITDQVNLDLNLALKSFFQKYNLHWAEIRYLNLDGQKQYVYAAATSLHLKEIKRQLDDAGVRVAVLDTAVFKVTLPGTTALGKSPAYVDPGLDDFNRQMEDLKRASDAAHLLGTQHLRIFTFLRVAQPASVFDRVVEMLHRALDIASQQDVTLLVENEYDCNVGTSEEIARLFTAIPDRRLMHNWDPCNSYEIGEQPFPFVWNRLDHSRISHIHLKDAKGKDWKPIGAGEVDLLGQLQALRRIHYEGTLSVETRYMNKARDQYASSVESMDGLLRILHKV